MKRGKVKKRGKEGRKGRVYREGEGMGGNGKGIKGGEKSEMMEERSIIKGVECKKKRKGN